MLSRYRIGEKLGAGRRGIVYPAVDISLKRPVAPKFLSGTSLSEKPTRARFLLEAQTAVALSHPSVCAIYEVGEVQNGQELSKRAGLRVHGERPTSQMEPSVQKRGKLHAAARRLQSLKRCTELLTRTAGTETTEEVRA